MTFHCPALGLLFLRSGKKCILPGRVTSCKVGMTAGLSPHLLLYSGSSSNGYMLCSNLRAFSLPFGASASHKCPQFAPDSCRRRLVVVFSNWGKASAVGATAPSPFPIFARAKNPNGELEHVPRWNTTVEQGGKEILFPTFLLFFQSLRFFFGHKNSHAMWLNDFASGKAESPCVFGRVGPRRGTRTFVGA